LFFLSNTNYISENRKI